MFLLILVQIYKKNRGKPHVERNIYKEKTYIIRWRLIFGMKKEDFLPVNATLFYRKVIKYLNLKNNGTKQTGSRAYLISIVMVAVLGGLLFGYDTAVISGAEKGLQAFFMGAEDFTYTDFWHGFTSSSALIGCIIGSALSGVLASNWGRKRSLIFAGVMFFISAWGFYVS